MKFIRGKMQSKTFAAVSLSILLSCGEAPPSPICGDGVTDANEACDDGNNIDTDSCRNSCQLAACGDGVILAGVEECDDANQIDDDDCANDCTSNSCGDGVVNGADACDDANQSNTDDCLNNCQLASCGDGFVQSGVEECDDDNTNSGDGCDDQCQQEIAASCGDGVVNGTDECDDANQSNTDDCLNNCQLASCGDNFVQAGVEGCDDGNNDNGDGCDQSCNPENNAPEIFAINPNNTLVGFETDNVIITGDSFVANASVTIAGAAVPTTSCDYSGVPTQIECTIPVVNSVLRGDVVVTNPDNQSDALVDGFTFTGVVTDADFCNVQFPKDLIAAPGTSPVAINTDVLIFGQIFESGLTNANNNAAPGIIADFGLSAPEPAGADIDPTASTTWRFRAVQPNPNFNFGQSNDEYFLSFVPNTLGNFRYAFRFSFDNGLNFTYCDKDDSNNGFDGAQTSQMQVIQ